MKIKRIDLYKSALWNKILVLCVIKDRITIFDTLFKTFKVAVTRSFVALLVSMPKSTESILINKSL